MKKKYLLLSVVALTLVLAGCKVVTQPEPYAPSDLVGFSVSPSEINLTWKDNSSDETGFYIYRKTTDNYSKVGVVLANNDFYSDEGLDPKTTYTYKVTAYNDGGESSPSNEVSVTTLSGSEEGVYLTGWYTSETSHGTWIYIEGRNNTDRDIVSITLLAILYRDGQVWERFTLKIGDQYGLYAPARSSFTLSFWLCQARKSEGDFDEVVVSIAEVEF